MPSERKMLIKNDREDFIKSYGMDFISLVPTLNIELLLKIGKRICSTDYAVRFYYNKNHPKFYKQKDLLIKAIRRAYSMGAFNHREQAHEIVRLNLEGRCD